jgi:hypothetical protein
MWVWVWVWCVCVGEGVVGEGGCGWVGGCECVKVVWVDG